MHAGEIESPADARNSSKTRMTQAEKRKEKRRQKTSSDPRDHIDRRGYCALCFNGGETIHSPCSQHVNSDLCHRMRKERFGPHALDSQDDRLRIQRRTATHALCVQGNEFWRLPKSVWATAAELWWAWLLDRTNNGLPFPTLQLLMDDSDVVDEEKGDKEQEVKEFGHEVGELEQDANTTAAVPFPFTFAYPMCPSPFSHPDAGLLGSAYYTHTPTSYVTPRSAPLRVNSFSRRSTPESDTSSNPTLDSWASPCPETQIEQYFGHDLLAQDLDSGIEDHDRGTGQCSAYDGIGIETAQVFALFEEKFGTYENPRNEFLFDEF